MFFSEEGLVGLEGAIRVSLVLFGEGEVAEIPLHGGVGVQVFFDGLHVEEDVNSYVVDAAVVSGLMQAVRE